MAVGIENLDLAAGEQAPQFNYDVQILSNKHHEPAPLTTITSDVPASDLTTMYEKVLDVIGPDGRYPIPPTSFDPEHRGGDVKDEGVLFSINTIPIIDRMQTRQGRIVQLVTSTPGHESSLAQFTEPENPGAKGRVVYIGHLSDNENDAAELVRGAIDKFHGINGHATVRNHRGDVDPEKARRKPRNTEAERQKVVTAVESQLAVTRADTTVTTRSKLVLEATAAGRPAEHMSYPVAFRQIEAAALNGPREGTLFAPSQPKTIDDLSAETFARQITTDKARVRGLAGQVARKLGIAGRYYKQK